MKTMDRFSTRKSFLQAMTFQSAADPNLIDRFWSDPDSLVHAGEKLIKKNCVRTTVRLNSEYDQFVVKRHVERSWRHFAKQCVTRSRAERCWNDSLYLYENGYPTPRPIAYLEDRLGVLRGNSYFMYQFVEGETLKQKATDLKNQRLIRKYILQLVNIWKLHFRLRVNLSDGHPANFLINSAGKMWVIDLDKLQRIPTGTDIVPILKNSFESTMRGVFWDRQILKFGREKLGAAFSNFENEQLGLTA